MPTVSLQPPPGRKTSSNGGLFNLQLLTALRCLKASFVSIGPILSKAPDSVNFVRDPKSLICGVIWNGNSVLFESSSGMRRELNSNRTIEQALEMETRQLVVAAQTDQGSKGRRRRLVSGFRLSERLQVGRDGRISVGPR